MKKTTKVNETNIKTKQNKKYNEIYIKYIKR